MLDTLFLPIELEVDFDARIATAHIPGVLTSRARPLINEFSGDPFHVALARPSGSIEFTYADLALGNTAVTGGLDMSFEGAGKHRGGRESSKRSVQRQSSWRSI